MVRIDKLILPGNFPERLESEDVAHLSESINQIGMISVPIVREDDLRVLAGRDRVAAKRVGGEQICEVRIVRCTETEAELIELDENLQRRHHTQEQIDAMRVRRVELEKKLLAERQEAEMEEAGAADPGTEPPESEPSRGRGRPRNQAVHNAAKQAGVSTSTVYRSQRRNQGREKPRTPAPPSIKAHGIEIPEETKSAIADLVRLFAEADRHVRNAQSAMTRVQSSKLPLDASILSRIKEDLAGVASRIRSAAPSEACAYCKWHPVVLPECAACGGSGFLRVDQVGFVMEELKEWDLSKAVVSYNGNFVKYSEIGD